MSEGNTVTGQDAVYDFGSVAMGKQAALKLGVKNTGSGALTLTKLEKQSGDAVKIGDNSETNPVFTFEGLEGKSLGAGESAEFTITFDSLFDSTAKQVKHDAKLILRADNSSIATANVEVKGTSISGECDIKSPLDFGAVAVGDTYSDSTIVFDNSARPIDSPAFVGNFTSSRGDDKNFSFTPETPKGDFVIPAGKKKTIGITFAPTQAADYLALVTMRAADGCPDVTVKLIGTGVTNALTWAPSPLNFGYITPGLSQTLDLTFSNFGRKQVDISMLKPLLNDYEVVAPTTGKLTVASIEGADGKVNRDMTGAVVPSTAVVTIKFTPKNLGPRNSQLSFVTNLAKQMNGNAPLQGYGGGPDIDVKPSPILNFGRVAYFANASPASYAQRKMTITNVGTRPTPPDPKANLRLGKAGNGAPYFEVQGVGGADPAELCVGAFDTSGKCTYAPATTGQGAYDPQLGLEAAGTRAILDVPVRVTPKSVGQREWKVIIYSNDADEASYEVTVRAEAVILPPCNYTIAPPSLNFGLLTPPDYKDLSFSIKNNGVASNEICLVSTLDMKSGSDPIFSLPAGALDNVEIQPGQSISVPVRAWPQGTVPAAVQNVTGQVEFSISSPINPVGNVTLNASIAQSCLSIAPDDLNFGTVQKDCNSSVRTFTVYNTCSTNVKVNSFSMAAPAGEPAGGPNCPGTSACPEFIPVNTSGIAPGSTLMPTAMVTFSLRYRPINYGADTGAFLINVTQNSQAVDYLVTLRGTGDTLGLNVDVFKQDAKPKADILLVIDNSCSMSDKQQALASNFTSFIKYANTAQVDYQIGVTTTDMDVEAGRLISGTGHPEKILKPTTVDVENKFKAKVNVGTNGSATEMGLAPAAAALTAPLITTDNAGFIRQDAVLAVVVVSDAPDQSPQPVAYYLNQLINVKGAQRASQFTFNVIGGTLSTSPSGCTYDGSPGSDPRYPFAVTQTNGVKEEICTPDWSKTLEQVGKNAFGYRTNFFLTSNPDLSGGKVISVEVDGKVVPTDDPNGLGKIWTYDAASNSVNFEPSYVPDPGSTLKITYYVSCIP
ncbi:MAG: choice-of-anchor D domain-containing protein [Myxococcaceae bacterium]|nr:choice-of-anchor D domain-containing protein [Myxococcaceae bacterium]